MRKLIIVFLALLTIIAWKIYFDTKSDIKLKYEKNISVADQLYEMNAYDDSIDLYIEANKIIPNDKSKERILDIYLIKKEYENAATFVSSIEGEIKHSLTEKYLNHLIAVKEYKQINKFIKENSFSDFAKIKRIIKKHFTISDRKYADVIQLGERMFLVNDGVSDMIINDKERVVFPKKYNQIIGFDENAKLVTVKQQDVFEVVDIKGNIKSKIKAKDIYRFNDEYYVCREEKSYVLLNRLNEINHTSEYISNVSDGMFVSVKSNVISVMNKNLKVLAPIEGNKVKVNQDNTAIFGDRLVVEQNGAFIYNIKDKTRSKNFEDVDFPNGSLIAVKKDGKWGFIDNEFNPIIDFKYDYAKSFSEDIGYVYSENAWKFIDQKGEFLEDVAYEQILPFNKIGIGFIKQDGLWSMIKMATMEE